MFKTCGILVIIGVSLCFKLEKPTTGCDRGCPKIYNPVCASDGKTYPNKCQLEIATCKDASIKFEHRGKCGANLYDCRKSFGCSFLHDPLCGTDGKTYSNYCYFRKAVCKNPNLKKAHSGRCLESAVRPVLGADFERIAVPPTHIAAVRPLQARADQQSYAVEEKLSKRVFKRSECCPLFLCRANLCPGLMACCV